MNCVLLLVEQMAAVHDYRLKPNLSQGTVGGNLPDRALARVKNRLSYVLIENIYAPEASYAAAISQAHCINVGNKRTAFWVMGLVLDLNEASMAWDTELVGPQIIELTQSRLDEVGFVDWFRRQADPGLKGRDLIREIASKHGSEQR